MSYSLRAFLLAAAHYGIEKVRESVEAAQVPEQRRELPTRAELSGRRPVDTATRVHVDGSHRRDRWTYRDDAEGWVLEGLPSLDWKGRPAGIDLDTIHREWPIKAAALRRMVDPVQAEADRRACQFRTVRR